MENNKAYDQRVPYEDLPICDLIVDTIYEGGNGHGKAAEVLNKLMGCSNSSGFRKVKRKDGSGLTAYIVLFTSMDVLEWPDYLNRETGILRYYGDNRKPGQDLLGTSKQGNRILENVFADLNSEDEAIRNIPPFFVFQKEGKGYDVRFLGLAAPGNPKISPDRDLVAFWRNLGENRFQNYEAYFTILDTKKPISRKWLDALVYNNKASDEYAPDAWKSFKNKGRNGIIPLLAPIISTIPSTYDQLQSDEEGNRCIRQIWQHYQRNPFGFENCAKSIVEKLDNNFQDLELTRERRDGGRDAVGYYAIWPGSPVNQTLRMPCAMEAKCYSQKHGVGVHDMSRLISRIRMRQFGVMVTTSYIDKQAYQEVIDDQHPILMLTATNIAAILRKSAITSSDMDEWLKNLDESDPRTLQKRIAIYYHSLKK